MSRASRTASPLAFWDLLQRTLSGRFSARARGLLGTEFSLLGPEGAEFGRMRMRGPLGAEFWAQGRGDTPGTEIARGGGPFATRYRMTTGGVPVLLASPANPERGLKLFCGGKTYEAEFSVLRNTATARLLPDGDGEVRLKGGLAGRGYQATFPEDDGASLAVAVFLLYRNVGLRREAF